MSFFDTTASKWGLQIEPEIPKPSTKGFIDLLSSASSSSASLLEGLVLLWATEHVSVDASLQFETNAIDVIISVTALRGITQAHSPTTTRPAQITRYPHT
jgi:hypothetical protein